MADFDVVGRVTVDDTGGIGGVVSQLGDVTGATQAVQGATSALGTVADFVWAQLIVQSIEAAVGALHDFLGGTVGAAANAQDAMAMLGAVLSSTGGSAGVTADAASAMAKSLSDVSDFSQTAGIQAETMLLRFQKIGKDVFPQALQASADLATAMGTDLPQAAQMIGKALGDPEAGIGRLNMQYRVFDKEQMKVIENMAKHGKVAEAQKLILAGLAAKFGGEAAVAAATFNGKMEQMKNKFEEAQIQIGSAFLPVLSRLVDMIGPVFSQAIQTVLPVFQDLGSVLDDFVARIQLGVPPFQALKETLATFDYIPAVKALEGFVGKLETKLGPAFAKIGDSFNTIGIQLTAFWQAHGDQIIAAVGDTFFTIASIITGVMQLISGIIAAVTAAMNGNWNTALAALVGGARGFVDSVAGIFGGSASSIGASWSAIWDDLIVLQSALTGKVVGAVVDTVNSVITSATNTAKGILAVGKSMIDGLVQGIYDNAAAVIAAMGDIVEQAIKAAKKAAGFGSPAKQFIPLGKSIPWGIAEGIIANAHLPALALKAMIPAMATSTSYVSNRTSNVRTSNTYNFGMSIYGGGSGGNSNADLMQKFRKG